MTGDYQQRFLKFRQEWAQRCIENPHLFKTCDQCRSISYEDEGRCYLCGCYRFNESPEFVIESAKIIGSSPFPAGVVPRLCFKQKRRSPNDT